MNHKSVKTMKLKASKNHGLWIRMLELKPGLNGLKIFKNSEFRYKDISETYKSVNPLAVRTKTVTTKEISESK